MAAQYATDPKTGAAVNGDHLAGGAGYGQGQPISRAISYTLTPEQFESLYLQPGGVGGKGDLTKRLGNPTPVGVCGFLLCLTPFSCYLMGFGGTSATSAIAQAGPYLFLGGMLEIIAGIMEFILGNTFPMLVFLTFGGFWISFGFLQLPSQELVAAYAASGASAASGQANPLFAKGLAIYLIMWGFVTFIYLIASLRTNVAFVILFASLDVGFFLLVKAYFLIGDGRDPTTYLKAAGALTFITTLCGWWILAALVMGSTGMPFGIPVGDLSGFLAKKKKPESSTV